MISVPRRYRFVVQDRDRHGNVRTYLRRPGQPKLRLQHQPGTDAFDTEYRAIIEGDVRERPERPKLGVVAPGSVKAACLAYYGSSAFKQLDKRTQHVRRLILGHFVDAHGDKPFNRIETRHIVKWRDEKADTPEAANGLLKALRGVFKHAVATAVISRNIVRDVPYIPSRVTASTPGAWTRSASSRRIGRSVPWPASRSPCCSSPASAAAMWCSSGSNTFATEF